jgi:hypothetical protein
MLFSNISPLEANHNREQPISLKILNPPPMSRILQYFGLLTGNDKRPYPILSDEASDIVGSGCRALLLNPWL